MIYLDNAATTRMDPRVLEAMMPYMDGEYGNPGSLHAAGRRARQAVEEAREKLAAFLQCAPKQVVFTSGGTEGNNMVMHHFAYLARQSDWHMSLLTSGMEHDSIELTAAQLNIGRLWVPNLIDPDGSVNADVLCGISPRDMAMCSVQGVNNETGAVHPVADIGAYCRENGILFHTDCVQAAGFFDISVEDIGCDFATVSSHKIHGPKGVGALFIREPKSFHPLIIGGEEQEFELRGGTENVAGIVGFGKAAELAMEEMEGIHEALTRMKSVFYMGLLSALSRMDLPTGMVHINGPYLRTPGRILNLRVDGVDGESLVLAMDAAGVCISAGSACRSHSVEPSRTLKAMGLTDAEARQSVRISFSRMNTISEVYDASQIMADKIGLLTGGVR